MVKMLAIAFGVMLALPLAYRLWVSFNPPQQEPQVSLIEMMAKATADNQVRLLTTSVEKWLPEERRNNPELVAWLGTHKDMVLPWEWSEAARKKDPEGYGKAWLRIIDETASGLAKTLKRGAKAQKKASRELDEADTLYSHHTNQLALVKSIVATNRFPCEVTVERLSKGRFWGWNRKAERIAVKDAVEASVFIDSLEDECVDLMKTRTARVAAKNSEELLIKEFERRSLVIADCKKLLGKLAGDFATADDAVCMVRCRPLLDGILDCMAVKAR